MGAKRDGKVTDDADRAAERLRDRKALKDMVRRVRAKNADLRQEPLPDPSEWAIQPRHDTDDQLFEELCFHMFAAGFSRTVVRQKWPAIRQAFRQFDLEQVARIRPATVAKLAKDSNLIRNRRKLAAVVANAGTVNELAAEHGSWRRWLDSFPQEELYLLHRQLAARFECVGPSAAEWFLLTSGYPYYFATDHARRVLRRLGLTHRAKPRPEDINRVFQAMSRASGATPWQVSAELFLFGSGFRAREAICGEDLPLCPKCPLWDHCDHFNQR